MGAHGRLRNGPLRARARDVAEADNEHSNGKMTE